MDNSTAQCSTGNFSADLAVGHRGETFSAPVPKRLPPAGVNIGGAHAPALISSQPLQPIRDVREYLATRKPHRHHDASDGERELWITIPTKERDRVTDLLVAIGRVNDRVAAGMSVTRACAEVLAMDRFRDCHWNLNTFRALYDIYTARQDWVCLVNRSKCKAGWKSAKVGLADAFLDFVAGHYLARYAREDAKRQAILALHRHWRTGRDPWGNELVIAGYEVQLDGTHWKNRNRELLPVGWTYGNIMRQIKARAKFQRAEQALLHDSTAAATQYLPHHASTRAGMLFLQEVTFDDVRFDYLIFNKATGQQEELWALIARDTATGMVLGIVLYPAGERPDGTVAHLGAQQMKELAGQLLETFPLPPYLVTWKVERGTATLAAAVRAALGELFGNRIKVSYTKMLGDKSPVGYAEKKKGNSRGKAGHESDNRLWHTTGSFLPGQTGNRWDVRPADLKARVDEAKQIMADGATLPEHIREQLRVPLLTLAEARVKVREIALLNNFRTDHGLEDSADVLEWFDPADKTIKPRETIPNPLPTGARIIQRKESPVERAKRLIAAVGSNDWRRCSPAVVIAFLEHRQKWVPVNERGEISFEQDGTSMTFRHAGQPLVAGSKVLAYFHTYDPGYLHLTDGQGSILGTWWRKGRVKMGDREGLAEAMRYTQTALSAAKERAKLLAAPQVADLEKLRAHNKSVHEFIEVTTAPDAELLGEATPAGAALVAISQERQAKPQRKISEAEYDAETFAALRKAVQLTNP